MSGLKPLTSISALTTPTCNLFHGSARNTFQLPLPQADDPSCKCASCPGRNASLPIESRSEQHLRHGGLSTPAASFVQWHLAQLWPENSTDLFSLKDRRFFDLKSRTVCGTWRLASCKQTLAARTFPGSCSTDLE